MKSLAFLAALLAIAGPAWASQSVQLRSDAAAHAGRVTLADLFDDAGAASAVTLAAGLPPGGQVVLDAGRVQAIAAAHGLSWANPDGLRVIIARADAAGAPLAASAAERARPGGVLTYARDLRAGDLVQPEDVVWTKSAAYGAPSDTPRDAREAIGLVARRPVRAGAMVSQSDLSAPMVIRKDDVVMVVYEAGGVKLSLQGTATGAAAVGQNVGVLNPASKKIIEAVASGPGQALVGPRADELKAAARAIPSLVASLR
jgi:flagella basal body P-ring formation protein FlgA